MKFTLIDNPNDAKKPKSSAETIQKLILFQILLNPLGNPALNNNTVHLLLFLIQY